MCIFCQIIAGAAEASFVHQDTHCVAFMNLRPINPGEFMVIPRAHIDHFTDLPDALAAHIMVVAQRLGRHMHATLSPQRVGYVVHGFGILHAHLNVVPLTHSNDIIPGKHLRVHDKGFDVTLDGLNAPDRAQLDAMAARLRLEQTRIVADWDEPPSTLDDGPAEPEAARVVAETENRISGSHARNRLASVDLPAPEGEERMIRRPRRGIRYSALVRAFGR